MILRRLTSSRFSEVLPGWSGDVTVIIGGGSSLTLEQVELVRAAHWGGSAHCIAVNDAYLLAPWADVQYAADAHWHQWHIDGVERPGFSAEQVRALWKEFKGEKCSIESFDGQVVNFVDVHMLRNKTYPSHGWGLSFDPRALVTGRNSGFQALNLAVLAGSKKIVLIGFDGKQIGDKPHWFGEHPRATPVTAYAMYREAMSMAEKDLNNAGVVVINCSPGSAIDSFPKMKLQDVLHVHN